MGRREDAGESRSSGETMNKGMMRFVEELARAEGLTVRTPICPYTSIILRNDKRGDDEEVIAIDAGTRNASLETARLYLLGRRRERLALHQPRPRLP